MVLCTGLAALTVAFPAQVNTIADAIRDEFPHVAVSTLAYDYGEQPPAVTKPRGNVQVHILLLTTSSCCPLPVSDGPV
eukprot:SAG22_NODE_410_length_10907_cov_2.597520_9_plen_78_part_00